MAAFPTTAFGYTPRDTQATDLFTVLHEHLDEFLERTSDRDPPWHLPRFVRRQLEAMLDCGDISKGFVRLECSSCRAGRVVPFS